ETSAYGFAQPASMSALAIDHKRPLHQGTPCPFFKLPLVGCKHVRPGGRVSDRRIIRNDYRGAGLKFIGELVGEVRTKMQSRCHCVGIHCLPFASYPHPSRLFMLRCEPAGFSSSSFEHGEHVVSKLVTSA